MAVEVPFLSDISAFLKSVECVLGITFGKTTIPLSNQISRRSHLENLLNLLCLSFSACSPRLSKDGQNALIWIQLILKGRHLTQRPFWQLAFLRSPSSGNLQQEIPSVALKPRETSQKKRLLQSLPHAFELCLCTFDGSFRREVGLGRSSGSRDGWSYTRSTLARHLSSVRATSLRSWSLSVVKRGKCKERNHKNLFSEQMRWIHKNGCALGTLSCLGIHV